MKGSRKRILVSIVFIRFRLNYFLIRPQCLFLFFYLCVAIVPSGTEINSETDEPDSLETTKDVTSSIQSVTGTIRQKKGVGKITSSNTQSANESDLLALLQLERLAQQASRRDYELLRKQYQRYFFFIPRFF